jgi:hypothetical protein
MIASLSDYGIVIILTIFPFFKELPQSNSGELGRGCIMESKNTGGRIQLVASLGPVHFISSDKGPPKEPTAKLRTEI